MASKKEKEVTVVRVNRKEFELSDGEIYEHPLELDETPTLKEFKKYYHYWKHVLNNPDPRILEDMQE